MNRLLIIGILTLLMGSCENRDVNYGSGPNFSEIHEDIHYHFDKVAIDGSEYYILERDRNNPHEGFGFMALKGTDLKANQDSIKAYLKTILDMQIRLSAKVNNQSEESAAEFADDLFQYYIQQSASPYYVQENGDKEDGEEK